MAQQFVVTVETDERGIVMETAVADVLEANDTSTAIRVVLRLEV
jgi:hypothetical protein